MLETIIREVNAVAGTSCSFSARHGNYLTLGLGFMTPRKVPVPFRYCSRVCLERGEGDIVPFKALMTSLSATIGTGNIAGVATAITFGGPAPCSDVDHRVVRHGNKIRRGCLSVRSESKMTEVVIRAASCTTSGTA